MERDHSTLPAVAAARRAGGVSMLSPPVQGVGMEACRLARQAFLVRHAHFVQQASPAASTCTMASKPGQDASPGSRSSLASPTSQGGGTGHWRGHSAGVVRQFLAWGGAGVAWACPVPPGKTSSRCQCSGKLCVGKASPCQRRALAGQAHDMSGVAGAPGQVAMPSPCRLRAAAPPLMTQGSGCGGKWIPGIPWGARARQRERIVWNRLRNRLDSGREVFWRAHRLRSTGCVGCVEQGMGGSPLHAWDRRARAWRRQRDVSPLPPPPYRATRGAAATATAAGLAHLTKLRGRGEERGGEKTGADLAVQPVCFGLVTVSVPGVGTSPVRAHPFPRPPRPPLKPVNSQRGGGGVAGAGQSLSTAGWAHLGVIESLSLSNVVPDYAQPRHEQWLVGPAMNSGWPAPP
eukprot:gene20436-biopygen10110